LSYPTIFEFNYCLTRIDNQGRAPGIIENKNMPKKVDWNSDSALITYSGQITLQDLRDVGREIYGDQRLDDIDYILVDLKAADLSQLTFDHTKIAASVDSVSSRYKPVLKLALIINGEGQRRACESYIEYSKSFQSTWSFAIFTNFEEAKKWCELN